MRRRPSTLPLPDRRQWALALTLGMHLLAALLWVRQRPVAPRPAPGDLPRMVTILLQPVRLPAPLPAPAPTPRPVQRPVQLVAPPPAKRITPAPSPATPAGAALQSAGADSPPAASDPAPATAPSGAGFSLDQARRQAGGIDRELRKGKSGVPTEADTPMARFQRNLEAAHVEPVTGVQQDSYTSPDGVVIYRTRVGKRTFCRVTGSVGLGIAGARGINDAGSVSCPTGVVWQP